MIALTVPNLIAFDLVSVQGIDNRYASIQTLDMLYDSNKGETAKGDVFNSSINMGPSDPAYTSNLVNNETVALTASSSDGVGKLAWTPILQEGFVVTVGGDSLTIASVSGTTATLSGTGSTVTAGTLDLATGAITLTGASGSSSATAIYRFDNESVKGNGPEAAGFTNVPSTSLKLRSLPIFAQARTLRAYWAFDAAFELKKEYGENLENILATQCAAEINHEIDQEICNDLLLNANASAPKVWSRTQPVGVSIDEHYSGFRAKLMEASYAIFNATRKYMGNFVVGGIEVATVLQSMRDFKATGSVLAGPHFIGTLGNIKCYVNPAFPANQAVVGFKGSNLFEAGLNIN